MFSFGGMNSFISTPPVTVKCGKRCGSDAGRKYHFTWDTTRQCATNVSQTDPITSPPFRLGSNEEIEACIVMYPYGVFLNFSDVLSKTQFIALGLRITSLNPASIRGHITFKIEASDDEHKLKIKADTTRPGMEWRVDGVPYIFSYPHARYPTIACTIILEEWTEAGVAGFVSPTSAGFVRPTSAGAMAVLKGYKKLCMSDLHSDVTIVVGEIHLKAHKVILSTQSPVFEAMFSSDFEEAKTNLINIVDTDVEVVKEMLRYIYSGSVDDLQGTAEGLLVAADKYCLPDLKAMCVDELLKMLTVDNVSRVLRLADLHGAQQLKVDAADFMRCHMVEVQVTDGWKELKKTSAELIVECFVEKHS